MIKVSLTGRPSGSSTSSCRARGPTRMAVLARTQAQLESVFTLAESVSTIYFSPFFTGFFSRKVFLHFSHEFSRENIFSRKFLSIFLLDFSRDLSNSLDCFFARSYLRSLKFLIFGD
jgi:hypothetical protein